MRAKWLAALAVLVTTSAPAAAQVGRSSAPVAEESQLVGESSLPMLLLIGILGWSLYLFLDEESDDSASP